MTQSIETALLYNLQDSDSGRKLKMILLKMKIRIRKIEPSQYLRPVGALAGIRGLADTDEIYSGELFTEPMLLLRGFTDSRLDLLLASMRKDGIQIPLKAVLTSENQTWNSLALYEELKKRARGSSQFIIQWGVSQNHQ